MNDNNVLRVVLIGPPGSGKGTQARRLVQERGLRHVVPGDALRRHVRDRTILGLRIQEAMDSGKLIDSKTVNEIALGEISESRGGWVVDGYPRTMEQSQALETHLRVRSETLTCAISLVLSEGEIRKRISLRLVDPLTGVSYIKGRDHHQKTNHLTRRTEDDEKTVDIRLNAFYEQTMLVLDHYKKKERYYEVDASRTESEVARAISQIIDGSDQIRNFT